MAEAYDPEARRDTPLGLKMKEEIRREGEVLLASFICDCLWDETHGYYATKAVLGKSGDFITAPEISQIFGELLGLWSAVVWQQMGSPSPVNLVELGPGRGTLMADALRAVRIVPGFQAALSVTMVEISPSLRALQKTTLAHAKVPISWSDTIQPANGPLVILANEFVDVFGPDQSIKTDEGWRWRAVGLDEAGRFQFTPSFTTRRRDELDRQWPDAPIGSIVSHHRSDELAKSLKMMAAAQPMAALLIDYGHTETRLGDTLQAVRNHVFEHPLCSPGEADLSVQVDFADLARELESAGFIVDGPVTQAEFLGSLGIIERASKLMAANPAKAGEIEAGVARLIAPNGMGTRFKVLGVRSVGLPELPGFGKR